MPVRDIGAIRVRLWGDTSQFIGSFTAASATLKAFSAQTIITGNAMAAMGRTMSLWVTGPLALLGTAGVVSFAKFDKAMTESLAIFDSMTNEMRKKMADTAKQLSTEVTFAAHELAEGYFFLGSAGLNAAQSMEAIGPVARFAQAGTFQLAEATEMLNDAQLALGLSSKDARKNMLSLTRVADVLTRANTLANAKVRQFAAALTTQAGPTMKALNIQLEAGVAGLAAFGDQGIKAERAGTMLSRFYRLLTAAYMRNTDAFKELNVELFTNQGHLRNLADIVGNLEELFDGMSERSRLAALSMMGIQARSQQAIFPFIGLSERIRFYEEKLRSATGYTDRVAKRQLEAFTNQLKLVRNEVSLAAMDIGESLAPTVLRLARGLKDGARDFTAQDEAVKDLTVRYGLYVAALGPAIWLTGKFIKGIGLATAAIGAGLIPVLIAGGAAIVAFTKNAAELDQGSNQLSDSLKNLVDTEQQVKDRFGVSLTRLREMRKKGEWLDPSELFESFKPEALDISNIQDPIKEILTKKEIQLAQQEADLISKMDDMIADRLKGEEKINFLLQRRFFLEQKVARAGREEAIALKSQLLDIQRQIFDAEESFGSKNVPQFAAAVEAGTVEAYRAQLGTSENKLEKIARNSDQQVTLLRRIVELQHDPVQFPTAEEIETDFVDLEGLL